MGFVMLGIATLTDTGINAAIFGMVAHGVITGMLFFIAGSMYERYHTRRDRRHRARRAAEAARKGALFVFVAIASLGLPGLAGFWGEVLALLAAFNPAPGLNEALFRELHGAGGGRDHADGRLHALADPAIDHGQRPREVGGRRVDRRRPPDGDGSPGRRCWSQS